MRSWQELEVNKAFREEPTDKSEIGRLLDIAARKMSDAHADIISCETTYELLYDAAYSLCNVVLRANGWRVQFESHHEAVFSAFHHLTDGQFRILAIQLDDSRVKRNILHYLGTPDIVSDYEARELRENVLELKSIVLSWLKENHPDLCPDT